VTRFPGDCEPLKKYSILAQGFNTRGRIVHG
jgi:hypothetical protein